MKIDRVAAAPAAAMAAAVLLPSWTPCRQTLSLALLGSARAWADEIRDPETMYFLSFPEVEGMDEKTHHLASRAASGLATGTMMLGAASLTRLLFRDRVLGAAVLTGAYLAGDAWLRDKAAEAKTAKEAREDEKAAQPAE